MQLLHTKKIFFLLLILSYFSYLKNALYIHLKTLQLTFCFIFRRSQELLVSFLNFFFQFPGKCICRAGFTGDKCNECTLGHKRVDYPPFCVPCTCAIQGSRRDKYTCSAPCSCKASFALFEYSQLRGQQLTNLSFFSDRKTWTT